MEKRRENTGPCAEEVMSTIGSIHGLLALAHYYENREELVGYLTLISSCILQVEQSLKGGGGKMPTN